MHFLFIAIFISALAGYVAAQDQDPDPGFHWEYFDLYEPNSMGINASDPEIQSTEPCGGFDIMNRTSINMWWGNENPVYANVHTQYCADHECHVTIEYARLSDTREWTELKTVNMTDSYQMVEKFPMPVELQRGDEIVLRARHVMSNLYTFFQV